MTRRNGPQMWTSVPAITAIGAVLEYDVQRCLAQLGLEFKRILAGGGVTSETSYLLRKTIRAFMGKVDGLAFAFRRTVLACEAEVGLGLSNRERARLRELKYDAASDTITDAPDFLSTEESLKQALRYFPRLFGSSYRLDTDGVAWRAFRRICKARNGFTHPKSLNDLSARSVLWILVPTLDWFSRQMQLMSADIAPRIGGAFDPAVIIADPFQSFREQEHPLVVTYSEDDHCEIAANSSQSLKYAELFLDHCHDERRCAIAEVGRKGRPLFGNEHQSDTRNAVRTVFSNVEAMIFVSRRFTLAAEGRSEISLTAEEREAFDMGEVEDRLAGAMTLWSREFGDGQVWRTSGDAWKNFRGARFLRNRLTHPKSKEDLKVGQQELRYLLAILEYYKKALSCLHLTEGKWMRLASALDSTPEGVEENDSEADNAEEGEAVR